jgi:NADH-quinone oxidoreductase subunit D
VLEPPSNPLAHLAVPFEPVDHRLKGYHADRKVSPVDVVDTAELLAAEGFSLDSITGVDWLADGQMEVVYDYFHPERNVRAAVRTRVPRDNPELPTISNVFPGANWHERETHDFFGIKFSGHPNLAPFLLPEDATYHPLRKDFAGEQPSPTPVQSSSQPAKEPESILQATATARVVEAAAVKERTPVASNDSAPQETFVLNLGPQHPATHGVLRVKMTMDGEYIVRAEPVCGYIHRMQEKMAENRSYAQFLPNTSRIDYLSALTYTHAFVGAVERAAKLQVPPRAEFIRVITSELNRISSHLVWWGAFLLDLGGFTPLLYAFDDREKILDLLEGITGARLTYSYFRIGGLYNDVDDDFIQGTRAFVAHMRPRLKMYKDLVTENIILRKRLIGIGPISQQMCRRYGASGPVIRGSGIAYDVRKVEPYSVYSEFDFDIPTFDQGDSMARYLVRMEEMAQSLRIIEQALDKLPTGPVMAEKVPRVLKLAPGDYCYAVEAARGRFMVRIVSDNKELPYRVKLRTPCLSNLSLFEEASRGMLLADALALMGSLDLVIPDIDR